MHLDEMRTVVRAADFAREWHGTQVRKYTGEPFYHHPLRVMELVSSVTNETNVLAAALLHDVVEDTGITIHGVASWFGEDVGKLVDDLTNKTTPSDGDRAKRKAMDRERIAGIDPRAKTIKLADRLDNLPSVMSDDPDQKFKAAYLAETKSLLIALKGSSQGGSKLWVRLAAIVVGYQDEIPG